MLDLPVARISQHLLALALTPAAQVADVGEQIAKWAGIDDPLAAMMPS